MTGRHPPFQPPPWLSDPHLQTIVGAVARPAVSFPTRAFRLPSAHGDALSAELLDHPPGPTGAAPVVLVLHGISGSSRARNVRYLMARLRRLPARVVGLNLRSCDDRVPEIPRLYHAGCSDDLSAAVDALLERFAGPLCLVGLSLGANILLKYLGEKADALSPRMVAACAVSSPLDLEACAAHLETHPLSRFYRWLLVSRLKQRARTLAERHPGVLCPRRLAAASTFEEFDEGVTAPLHGFEGAHDYWRKCSSLGFLETIRRPTLLLNAKDDPFVRPGILPRPRNRWILQDYPERGGHLGFIGPGFAPWMEDRVVHFFREACRGRSGWAASPAGHPAPDHR